MTEYKPTVKERAQDAWQSPKVKVAVIGAGIAILTAMFPELAGFLEQLGNTLTGQ